MSRFSTKLVLLAAVALGTVGTLQSPSQAATSPADPAPLGTHLRLHVVRWNSDDADPDSGSYLVKAPRGWDFSHDGAEGRFNDPTRTWLLRADYLGNNVTAERKLRRLVVRLRTVPRLTVLRTSLRAVHLKHAPGGIDDYVYATVTYRHVDASGHARRVMTRFLAYGDRVHAEKASYELTVAGRPRDARGLQVLLDRVSPTTFMAG